MLVLAVCSFVVLLRNALPLAPWKIGLVGVMSGAVAVAFLAPPLQRFFELRSPGPTTFAVVAATSGAAILAMGVAHTWAERPVRSERQAERVGAEARSWYTMTRTSSSGRDMDLVGQRRDQRQAEPSTVDVRCWGRRNAEVSTSNPPP